MYDCKLRDLEKIETVNISTERSFSNLHGKCLFEVGAAFAYNGPEPKQKYAATSNNESRNKQDVLRQYVTMDET